MIRAQAHFGKNPNERLREWQRYQRHLTKTREDANKRREQNLDEAADSDFASFATVVATTEEIEEFSAKLDAFDQRLETYHEASVEALIEANEKLEDVRRRFKLTRGELGEMRKHAFELEDGTRVFLSEDSTWAIDIQGNDVAMEKVPVEAVPPSARIADRFADTLRAERDLIADEITLESDIEAIHAFDRKREEHACRSRRNHAGRREQARNLDPAGRTRSLPCYLRLPRHPAGLS
ncbi:MAG: hypothetical protein KDJ29_13910 [Hyphomicrobiales bacterium]|nr:hypothetical protein [Hyphomicrobiales bacterium]